jgi:hypothetical protein
VRDCNGGLALFENSSGVGDDTAIQRLVLRQDWFFNCHRRGLFGSCRFSVEVAFVFECIEENISYRDMDAGTPAAKW